MFLLFTIILLIKLHFANKDHQFISEVCFIETEMIRYWVYHKDALNYQLKKYKHRNGYKLNEEEIKVFCLWFHDNTICLLCSFPKDELEIEWELNSWKRVKHILEEVTEKEFYD